MLTSHHRQPRPLLKKTHRRNVEACKVYGVTLPGTSGRRYKSVPRFNFRQTFTQGSLGVPGRYSSQRRKIQKIQSKMLTAVKKVKNFLSNLIRKATKKRN